jgi:hypothetical protein
VRVVCARALFQHAPLPLPTRRRPQVSRDSGPPSTVWAKPLAGGRTALLAINGADTPQRIALDFAALLGGEGQAGGSQAWEARDVWMGVDLGTREGVARDVPPHDCILLILTPH